MSGPGEAWVDGAVLGIETSGSLTGAALVRDGRLLAEVAADTRASTQELLLSQVAGLLASHGLQVRDLTRIGISLGPGSFTGLRVGLAAARALAWGAEVPLVGVPTHQALAAPFQGLQDVVVLLTGLRRGLVCLEAGRWDSGRWRPLREVRAVSVEEALDTVRELAAILEDGEVGSGAPPVRAIDPTQKDAARPRLLFLGEAVASLQARDAEPFRSGIVVEDPLLLARRPAAVAWRASLRDAPASTAAQGDAELTPLYVRGADAVKPQRKP